jgi:hypothetical protein
MRKLILGFALCFIAVIAIAATDNFERVFVVSGPRTGDGSEVKVFDGSGGDVVYAGECLLRAVTLRNEESSGKVTLYDNATAGTGTAIMIFGMATDEDGGQIIANINCANGIYATITNTADVTIEYIPLPN